jgi:hypothetical protein
MPTAPGYICNHRREATSTTGGRVLPVYRNRCRPQGRLLVPLAFTSTEADKDRLPVDWASLRLLSQPLRITTTEDH